tara:strand:- start:1487 stop:2359 length:873 start_codon:yes stop_codon:yes gene_type:complete
MTAEIFLIHEILDWRNRMLLKGGSEYEIDWLLDFAANENFNLIKQLNPTENLSFKLDISLFELERIWISYIEENIPLQYLLGRTAWRDFELSVSPKALIPRQETELLVDFSLKKFSPNDSILWADLGTGAGPLAIALAKEYPSAEGHAVDCSQEALSLAKINLRTLAPTANVVFHLGDWWNPLRPFWGHISLAVANPPYIPVPVIQKLDPVVRDHEPYLALSGGVDGLDSIRVILAGSTKALSIGGWLLLEHHHDQSEKVLDLMNQAGLKNLEFGNDLNGIKRFAMGQRI